MIDLTFEQIAAAKSNDISAVTAVIEATEERVCQLARRYATNSGITNASLAEDFEQQGRIAVWEGIARFDGESVAQFFTFIDTTVQGTLAKARRRETRQGVSEAAAYDFESALRQSAGDPFEAQRYAASDAMGARKMSPEMAYAARMSWQGVEYLDAPIYDADGSRGQISSDAPALAHFVAETLAMPADLAEPSDYERERKRVIRERVHATLGRMGGQAATVLRATFGIDPVCFYGTENDAEMAEDFGWPRTAVKFARTKGKARFAELWLKGAHLYDVERECVECETTRPVGDFPVSRMNDNGSPQYRPRCRDCHNATKRAA